VGLGLRDGLKEAGLRRGDFYVQTKYTSIHGQDPERLPYDPRSSIPDQVNASVASSLKNFRIDGSLDEPYLDYLVLHSPFPSEKQTQEAWRAIEAHVPKSVRLLGISNIYHLPALQALYDFAKVTPFVVQNRFYKDTGYDKGIRAFCAEKGITYQSFWTLTANPQLLRSSAVRTVADGAQVNAPVALYGLVLALGPLSVLNGTKSAARMAEDLQGVDKVKNWAREHPDQWSAVQRDFNRLLET
jgi:diketogulonate reductase-like aldo/keto reductase